MNKCILIFLILPVILSSCKSKGDRCSTYFELPLQIEPEQSTYKVGDTITFTSKFHKKLPAYNSNANLMDETFDMEGILWRPATSIARIDVLKDTSTSVIQKYFDVVIDSFDYLAKDILIGEYNFSQDTFLLEYQLIPRSKGTYILTQESLILPSKNSQDYPGKCFDVGGGGFAVWYKINDGVDNNIDFLLESPIESLHSQVTRDPLWDFHRAGRYAFKVVE